MRRKSKYTLNENAFSQLTNESAYWLGVLMADGSVDHQRGVSRLRLGLKDTELVEQFRAFLGSNHPIKDRGDVRLLEVTSHDLVSSIEQYGVVPAKTFIAEAHKSLASLPAFWRGVIDGDGCVFKRSQGGRPESKNIVLVGSESLMTQYLAFVKIHVPDCKATVRPSGTIFRVAVGGGPKYEPLFYVLRGTPCLSRKWEGI